MEEIGEGGGPRKGSLSNKKSQIRMYLCGKRETDVGRKEKNSVPREKKTATRRMTNLRRLELRSITRKKKGGKGLKVAGNEKVKKAHPVKTPRGNLF